MIVRNGTVLRLANIIDPKVVIVTLAANRCTARALSVVAKLATLAGQASGDFLIGQFRAMTHGVSDALGRSIFSGKKARYNEGRG